MKSDLEPFAMVPRDLIGNVSPRALEVWAVMAAWYVRDEKVFKPPVARIARALGCGRRTIEQALSELAKTGRLSRKSGKTQGRANEYELRFSRREFWEKQGAQPATQGCAEDCAPTNKVVKTFLKHTPIVPAGDARAELDSGWAEFWALYPRKDKAHQARQAWARLSPEEKTAAMQAVRFLAEVYKAAGDHRRRYTVQAHKWLAQRRWTDDAEATENHYHVAGLSKEAAAEARRRAANERTQAEFRQMMQRKQGA